MSDGPGSSHPTSGHSTPSDTTANSAAAATKDAWHAVAEHVLAGPQYRQTGTIRLRVTTGGFATIKEPHLRVELGELVDDDTGRRLPLGGTTCAELAAAVGLQAGRPADLYHDGAAIGPQAELSVDDGHLNRLARAFVVGDAALREFAPAQVPVLWPEHFDVAVTVDEVNYGVSAGDSFVAEPYAYVGPWQAPPVGSKSFWNAPFGATRPMRELPDEAAVLAFFTQGRDLARKPD
jgi:hypothetical protein